MQPVLPKPAEEEGQVQLRRRAQRPRSVTRSAPRARGAGRERAARRGRRTAARSPPAPRGLGGGPPPDAAAAPPRPRSSASVSRRFAASSSDFGIALRRCAKLSRIRSRSGSGGACRRRRSDSTATLDARPRLEDGGIDRPQHPHIAAELDDHARACHKPSSRAAPAAARRSRAGPSPSSGRPPAAPRSSAGSAVSRPSRAGWRRSR